jgi:uncharacterized protein with PIN domain
MSDKPFVIVKREDLAPVCPHCEEELTEVYTKAKGVPFAAGTNVVYFCPHCRKVLGIGHGRMI